MIHVCSRGGASSWIQLVSSEALTKPDFPSPPLFSLSLDEDNGNLIWPKQWMLSVWIFSWTLHCLFPSKFLNIFELVFFFHLHHKVIHHQWIITSFSPSPPPGVNKRHPSPFVSFAASYRKLKTQRNSVWRRRFLDWSWWTGGYDEWLFILLETWGGNTHTCWPHT